MIDIEKIKIIPEMLNIVGEIDEFKGLWQLLGKMAPDRLLALKKVATIESIGSSTRIEGSKLSDQEIQRLLSNVDALSFQSRDEQEVAGYAFVCEKIFENFDMIPISENAIKQMHIWLLQYCDRDARHRGEYKNVPIQIEAFDAHKKSMGVIFETVPPFQTPIKMHELVVWTRDSLENKTLHPLIVIGIFVVLFLAIHPFQDGNGRLSRLLTTMLMMKCGYQYILYSSLESIIEASKQAYYLALQRTQKSWQNDQVDWTPWLLLFLTCLQRQKQHLEQKVAVEQMFNHLPELPEKILELLKVHGHLKIREIEELTQKNRNTLKKALAMLVHNNFIQLHGKGKNSWYTRI